MVEGKVKVRCRAEEDSPYPEGLQEMCAQEGEQQVAPSEVEEVQEKLVGEE